LLKRVDETRLRSQIAQISRPKEQIDSNDGLEGLNESENTPSGAGESSNELLTSDRIASLTIQTQTSGELGNVARSPQNLWREPQTLPNCKERVYVYPYSISFIQEDHLRRFPVVIDIFKRNIEKKSELKLHMCEIDYTLKMCGPSPQESLPSIIVFCTKAVFPSLRSLLTSRHIASQYYFPKPPRPASIWRSRPRSDEEDAGDSQIPRFKIYFWWAKKMPRTLHWGKLENLRVYQPCHDSLAGLEKLTMCGSRIAATEDIRLATLGCLVKIQANFYGLSASHAFESIVRSTPLGKGASVGNRPSGNLLSAHSVTSQKGKDAYYLIDDVEYDNDDDESSVESIVPSDNIPDFRSENSQNLTEEIMKGNIIFPSDEFFAGTMKPDLDWALIEINEKQYKRPNAYIAVTEPARPVFFSKAASCHPGEQRDIVVISSALNPRRGVLLPGKSFLGGINRPNMCEVWNILLTGEEGECIYTFMRSFAYCNVQVLSRGDSGSLVIDLNTNEVYGHVVASNPLGEAYVVPLLATLGQIRESFHTQDVSLPEPLDFKDLQEYEEISEKQTLDTKPDALTALPPSYESNTGSSDMIGLASGIRAKQSSTSEVFFRICDVSSQTFFDARVSQPELIRRHSLGLANILDKRNTDREIQLTLHPRADFDISEVAWVIVNLQLPRLESSFKVQDPKVLARTCAVIWAYQCDPNLFKDLKIMIRPNSILPTDIWSDATTPGSRWWQWKRDIPMCGHLITTAFVLGSWGTLEDEIMGAVWGASEEVKVLGNVGIDIGGK
jgi:hypothetical protein